MTSSSYLFASDSYVSPEFRPSFLTRSWPSLTFYTRMLWIVLKAAADAKKKRYDGETWARSSETTVRALEKTGCRLEIKGLEHFRTLQGPCVFIANHMSTLETFALPAMIQPWKPVTFIVKQNLLNYPFFGSVLGARSPIVVGRTNPREDLTRVLEQGTQRLTEGQSVIVFPQSTRTPQFEPAKFNTIGIKLAKRAGVPVIPLALKSDAWTNGHLLKDFGPIFPERIIRFAFHAPLSVIGQGKEEHRQIVAFITSQMDAWKE